MPITQELECWQEEVSSAFAHLSKAQMQVLALYSYGMAITQRCGQTVVVVFLSLLLGMKRHNLRQRFKEFTYEKAQKRGEQRREIVVQEQFAPLLRWVLRQWHKPKQVVLGVDVTYLKDRYTILCISVLYGQTAIPVAWHVLPGHIKGEWHPLWVDLLAQIATAIPATVQVLVLFDRGLYSKRLFTVVRLLGWHPFMRIRLQGCYKRCNGRKWHDLKHLPFRGMSPRTLRVHCFKGDPLEAVLWMQWDAAADEPCLFLTDLTPRQLKDDPYPLRMWIEAAFKDFKRGGLHWEQSKIADAQRMERLLLVMTIALLHLVRLGNAAASTLASTSDPAQRLSLVTLGWLYLLVYTIRDLPLTVIPFAPYLLPPFRPRKNTYP